MADLKMNKFTTASDGAYIYGELSNGAQVKIKREDLVDVIREALNSRGYSKLFDYGQISGDSLNTSNPSMNGYGYCDNGDGAGFAGIFLSLSNNACTFQLKSDINHPVLKYRQTNYAGQITSGGWRSIKIE